MKSQKHTSTHREQELLLPPLRQDLSITPSAPGEDGSLCGLIYDPLNNKYYRIGQIAFTMLAHWEAGQPVVPWFNKVRLKDKMIEQTDFEQLLVFLMSNGLIVSSDPKTSEYLKKRYDNAQKRPNIFTWLFSHYLYTRLPLINPDRILGATLPYVTFFFHSSVRWTIRVLGLIGIVLISRQWEEFSGSISHLFSVHGAIIFGISLFLVKALHELGHAYTAKRQGCRVSCMGVAFIFLYPLLYTDTTDAWRLNSPKQRLAIVTAGVKTELAVAFLACFAWSFLDTGALRSLMFFIATTSIISSLAINMMPFMRFDGYYALSDFLNAENLQSRSFALGRWKLREILFGLGNPPPEALSAQRRNIFLLYAYATWLYRLVLFTGIALMVYHFVFKALGAILFVAEIYYFIGRPIINELRSWLKNRKDIAVNFRFVFTLGCLVVLITTLLIPWENHLTLPAVLEADVQEHVYSGVDGIMLSVNVKEGQTVTEGQTLLSLAMPVLAKNAAMLKRKAVYLQSRLDRHVGSTIDLKQRDVLLKELARVQTDLSGISDRMNLGVIRAPCDGRITRLIKASPGQWISQKTLLAEIVGNKWTHITAYLGEDQLHRIRKGASAMYYGSHGNRDPIPAAVIKISATSVGSLPHLEMASVNDGPIPVRKLANDYYRPESGFYRVVIKTKVHVENIFWRTVGNVRVEATAESSIVRAWRYGASVFIRESEL